MFVNLPSKIRNFSQLLSTAITFMLLMLGSYAADAASDLRGESQGINQSKAGVHVVEYRIDYRVAECEKGAKGACSGTTPSQTPSGAGGVSGQAGKTALA